MEITKDMNVLVGLDLSEMDEALIQYIQVVRKIFSISTITFLHNIKMSELPDELRSSEKLKKIADSIKEKLSHLIKSGEGITEPYTIEVAIENYSELAFLEASKRMKANLAILGNKQQLLGGGGLPQKLIRMLPHSTLLVPEKFSLSPKRVIEAIDFSKYSPLIYQVGKQIQKHNTVDSIIIEPVYVSRISWQFFPGPSRNEIKKIMEEDGVAKKKRWLRNFPESSELTILLAVEKSVAASLADYIEKMNVDLVIMGVTGTSSLTGLFMGSVANEFIQHGSNASVLIVKRTAI